LEHFGNKRNVPRKDTFFLYTYGGGKGPAEYSSYTVENVDVFLNYPLHRNCFYFITMADHCS